MNLGELLDRRRVLVPLEATDVRDATTRLAGALAASGAIKDEARFTALLEDEWPEDIVTVSGRAFLPHFRTDAVKTVCLALGITPAPIVRSADDPVAQARVVVLIVAPTSEASAYLRTMAAVARALSADDVLEAMHAAKTPDEVLRIGPLGQAAVPDDVTVRDVMSAAVTTIGPDAPLREAAHLMLGKGLSSMPVVGPNGEVLGVLSDRHLMRFLLPEVVSAMSTGQVRAIRKRKSKESRVEAAELPVREVMDRSVLCLAEDQTVADVAALMLSKEVDRFPVTRDGALVGYITRRDIVRKLLGA